MSLWRVLPIEHWLILSYGRLTESRGDPKAGSIDLKLGGGSEVHTASSP
jgi:hypothetical protein